jgi:alpha-ketoglutarate-dependent 2,4-dichlorophenoxyacetate dioxygenase
VGGLASEAPIRIESRPLHPLFGRELIGRDLAAVDDRLARTIEAEIGAVGMLLFRDVALDDAGLVRLAAALGPLQDLSGRQGSPTHVARISNLDEEGRMLPVASDTRSQLDANLLWHVDSTYFDPGATFSFLHARIVPKGGADTEYADLRVAWDMLPPARQAEIAPLAVDHSIFHSRALIGFDMAGYDRSKLPSITRHLVRRHAPSGRDALLVASHIERVDGLNYEAGRMLIDELTAIATAPDRIYRHRWRAGDLLMWDNRCMIHRATPYAQFDEPRDMRSARVVDVADDGVVRPIERTRA